MIGCWFLTFLTKYCAHLKRSINKKVTKKNILVTNDKGYLVIKRTCAFFRMLQCVMIKPRIFWTHSHAKKLSWILRDGLSALLNMNTLCMIELPDVYFGTSISSWRQENEVINLVIFVQNTTVLHNDSNYRFRQLQYLDRIWHMFPYCSMFTE